MGVYGGEVEFSGDEEDDEFHCFEAGVSAGLAFGGLMAFSVCGNHKQQEKAWAELPDYARCEPAEIRVH